MKKSFTSRLQSLLQVGLIVLALASAATAHAAAVPPGLTTSGLPLGYTRVLENTPLVLPLVITDDITGNPNTVTLSISTSDPTVLPVSGLQFSAVGTPTRNFTITPLPNQFGLVTVTITETSVATGLISTYTFQLDVNFRNQPPVFTPGANVSVNQNSATFSQAWATGIAASAAPVNATEAAQSVGFVVSNNAPALFTDQPAVSPTGVLTFTPALNAKGTATVTVTAKDNGSDTNPGSNVSAPVTFTVTINAVGIAPILSFVPAQVMFENGSLSVNLNVTEVNDSVANVTITGTSSVTSLIDATSIVQTSVGTSNPRTIKITPKANQSGSAVITLTAHNSVTGLNGILTFPIDVDFRNQAPVFTPGANVTVNQNSGANSQAWATAIAPSAAPINATEAAQSVGFTVSNDNNALFLVQPTISPTGVLSFFTALNAKGLAHVTAQLTDSGTSNGNGDTNGSVSVTFTITLAQINIPPVMAAITAQTIIEDSASAPITVNLTDVNGLLANVSLAGTSDNLSLINPGSFSFGGSGAARTMTITPLAGNFGSANVTLTATDSGLGLSSTTTFAVTVPLKNHAPTFTLAASPNKAVLNTAGAQTVAGEVATITPGGGAAGEAGQVVNFIVTNSNNGIFAIQPAIGSTGTLTFTPQVGVLGSATVTVIAHDDGGTANGGSDTSGPQTFTITVNPDLTVPPVISFIRAQQVAENGTLGPVSFTVSDVNDDPAHITFTGTSSTTSLINPGSFTFGGAAGNRTVTIAPLPNQFGTTTVTITALNNTTLTTSSTSFVVDVNYRNQAPVFTGGGAVSANQNSGPFSSPWATGIAPSAAPINAKEAAQSVGFIISNDNNPLFLVQPAISPTGVLTFQSALNAKGSTTVTTQLKDSSTTGVGETNASVAQTFVITIVPVPIPPTISAIGAQTVVEDSTSTAVNLSLGDVNDSVNDLVLLGTSGNTGLVNSASFTFGGSGAARTMTITPVAANFGTTTATVTVSNTVTLLTTTTTFAVNVLFKNHTPSFALVGGATSVVNGDFETGDLTGWTTASTGGSSWVVDDGTISTGGTSTVPVPHGAFAASETSGPGARVLYQDITLGSRVKTASMIVYYQNANGDFFTPATLDTGGAANQQYRIDLVSTNADPFSVNPGDVLTNLFITSPGSPANLSPTNMSFDVSAFAGQTVRLRFAEADNQFYFQAWVDNVQFSGGPNPTALNTAGAQTVPGEVATFSPGPASESSQVVDFIVSNDNNGIFAVQPAIDGTGTLTFTPLVGVHSSANVTVMAHDNGGTANGGSDTSAPQTFIITVAPDPSVPPVIPTIPPQQVAENGLLGPVSFSVTDVNDDPANVVFFGTSTTTSLVNSASFTFGGSAGNRTVSIAPLPNQFGTTTVILSASNSVTHSVGTATFVLGVNFRNQAPVFTTGGNVSVNQNSGAFSSTWATGIAPSAAPINDKEAAQSVGFVISNDNNPLFLVQPAIDPSGILSFQPALNAVGSTTVTAQLKDSGTTGAGETNASIAQTFVITVNPIAIPPTLSAISFQHVPESASSSLISITLADVNDSVNDLVLAGTSTDTTIVAPISFTFGGSGANRTLIITPLPQTFGQVTATVGVINQVTHLTNSTSFVVSVDFRNQAPTFTPGGNIFVTANSGDYSAQWASNVSPGPANESSQTVGFIVSNNNNSLFLVQPVITPTGVLQFTPAQNASGVASVFAQLKDSGESNAGETNGSARVTFSISVAGPRFTQGDVYFTGGTSMYKLKAGDNSNDAPFAALPAASVGKIAWSLDQTTAYIPLVDGTVCSVSATGVTTPDYATGLPGTPSGIEMTTGNRLFVATGSSVYEITGGGDFTCTTPAAGGFIQGKTLIQTDVVNAPILVADAGAHQAISFNSSAPRPASTSVFATVPAGPDDIVELNNGHYLVTDVAVSSGFIYDITAGGTFTSANSFASGKQFYSIVVNGVGHILSSDYSNNVWDVTSGGAISSGNSFATGLPGAGNKVYLSAVPALLK